MNLEKLQQMLAETMENRATAREQARQVDAAFEGRIQTLRQLIEELVQEDEEDAQNEDVEN